MRKRLGSLILVLALFLASAPALGEEAATVTEGVLLTQGSYELARHRKRQITDGDNGTYCTLNRRESIAAAFETEVGAVYLRLYERIPELLLEARVNGEWAKLEKQVTHLTDWYPLPEGADGFRVTVQDQQGAEIADISFYTRGDRPEAVQEWTDLEKADLMLVAAHPDDEILWFGGLLPTYAGERKLAVQVVTLVPANGQRELELLDSLWTCGVHSYPVFLNLRDKKCTSMEAQYNRWGGEDRVVGLMAQTFRQYRPEVVVTHGLKGEYGHFAHRTACNACIQAFFRSADPLWTPASGSEVWSVKKLYLHEYPLNEITLDWHVPLSAFGGRDAFSVAEEAMACHASQLNGWHLQDHGEHDNAKFGLYATTVGPDVLGNDVMENIPAAQE